MSSIVAWLAVGLIICIASRCRPRVGRVVIPVPPVFRVSPVSSQSLSTRLSKRVILNRARLAFVPARTARGEARRLARSYPDFIELLVLTVRSGYTPLQAFETLSESTELVFRPALNAVVQRVARGERFADAVTELPARLGRIAEPLADAFALCARYGLALAPILDRLADEARAQRRRNADAAARQLPIRLSFPLVGCTLPSFVLLTIVPLMAGTISSLQGLGR